MALFLRALTLLFLLSSVTVVAAQGDDDCSFEMLDVITAIGDADKAVEAGDSAAASAALDTAQALLDDFRARCVEPLAQSPFALTETYRAPGGIFTLRYPEGWRVVNEDNGLTAFGEPSLALESLANDPSDIAPGELLLVAQIIPGQENARDTAEQFAEDVRNGNNSIFSSVELIDPAPTNTLSAVRLEVASDVIAASLDIVDLGASQAGDGFDVLLIGVVSVAGEAAQARALLDAVAATMQDAETAISAVPTRSPVTVASTTGIGYDEIAFSTTQNLLDLDVRPVGGVALSPDGTRLAYMGADGLCIRSLASNDADCYAAPDGYMPPELSWSPDGRYLVGTADFFRILRDPDVILFDTEAERFLNLTNDNVERLRLDNVAQGTLIDIGVVWAQDSQSLYLYRHVPSGDNGLRGRHGIYSLALDRSDAELIVDLTPAIGELPYVYFSGTPSLDGLMTLSPDGSQIAFTVYGPGDESQQNGIWVYNLETDDLTPVVPAAAFVSGMNAAFADEDNIIPIGMSWSPSGGLYIHATAGYRAFSILYYDPATGDLLQINEPIQESSQASGGTGVIQGAPTWAAPLPNRDGVVYAMAVGDDVQIVKARAANGSVESDVILTLNDQEIALGRFSLGDTGADGTTVLGMLLLTP